MQISRYRINDRLDLVRNLLNGDEDLAASLHTHLTEDEVAGNIENFVGAVHVPLGLCGPIDIAGAEAKGSFAVPFATLEGALVASYSRGAKMMNLSGGCETRVYRDRFLRATQLTTASLEDSVRLVRWCEERQSELFAVARAASGHLTPVELDFDCAGMSVVVSVAFTTGDAMGSNMASKAIALVSDHIIVHSGLVCTAFVPYPEDKKNIPARLKGKGVVARTVLRADVVRGIGRVGVGQVADYLRNYKNALALHGSSSLNIHAVNGLAAMFQAFGQDMAYLGECSQAVVDCRPLSSGDLEVSVTLPTLIIGTVGGGTGLPCHRATLAMVDCWGTGKVAKLAEIMAATVLAGEVGCAVAQCAGEFVTAHETLGKNRPVPPVIPQPAPEPVPPHTAYTAAAEFHSGAGAARS